MDLFINVWFKPMILLSLRKTTQTSMVITMRQWLIRTCEIEQYYRNETKKVDFNP